MPAAIVAAKGASSRVRSSSRVRTLGRQPEMRIDAGVAVTRKMLAAGDDFLRLHRQHEWQSRLDHGLRRRSESTRADDRVCGVGVDVEHRREIEVEAEARQLAPHGAADSCRVPSPTRRIGEAGDGRRRAADATALVIDRNQKSFPAVRDAYLVNQPAVAVEPGCIGEVMAKIAFEQNDAGRLQILEQRPVTLAKDGRRAKTDDKMIAHRVD